MTPGAEELLEVAAGWFRQQALAQQRLRLWVATLVLRQQRDGAWRLEDSIQSTAVEVAARLGVSIRQVKGWITEGLALLGPLQPVAEAAQRGELDATKTHVFVQELDGATLEAITVVVDSLLPEAPFLPAAELGRRIRRALLQLDPAGQGDRATAGAARRHVGSPQPAGPGMTRTSALLPTPAAAALDQVCESAARATRAAGGGAGRTLEQVRADVLATLAEHALLTGKVGAEGVTGEVFTFDPTHARLHLTATREHQQGRSGGYAPDPTTTAPSFLRLAGTRPGADAPELHGYGPLPPALVPALVGKAWLLIEEPLDLTQVPPPTPSYQPTAAITRHVTTRENTCTVPGCPVPSTRCDLDHTTPWPHGHTCPCNLHPLCRTHHTLKTTGTHTLTITTNGTTTWTTPRGQALTRTPTGHHTRRGQLHRTLHHHGYPTNDLDHPPEHHWDDD